METLTPATRTDTATPLTPEVTAQVLAALRQPVPPDSVRERFGLSTEQFRGIIREQNQKVIDLIHSWQNDDSGYEEENAEAIDRALVGSPLSLREVGGK